MKLKQIVISVFLLTSLIHTIRADVNEGKLFMDSSPYKYLSAHKADLYMALLGLSFQQDVFIISPMLHNNDMVILLDFPRKNDSQGGLFRNICMW